eukprot:2413783-Prorocentrum_lima.AAC.1
MVDPPTATLAGRLRQAEASEALSEAAALVEGSGVAAYVWREETASVVVARPHKRVSDCLVPPI